MKKFLSGLQGAAALLIAVSLAIASPTVLRWIDPAAGAFDIAYLQRPLLGAVYFFFALFAAWVALQVDFPTIDKWIDRGGFRSAWEKLADADKFKVALAVLGSLMAAFLICIWLVPV